MLYYLSDCMWQCCTTRISACGRFLLLFPYNYFPAISACSVFSIIVIIAMKFHIALISFLVGVEGCIQGIVLGLTVASFPLSNDLDKFQVDFFGVLLFVLVIYSDLPSAYFEKFIFFLLHTILPLHIKLVNQPRLSKSILYIRVLVEMVKI